MSGAFGKQDREVLERRGISEAEAERQLELLRRPRRYVTLVRPCTVGDGIEELSDARREQLQGLHAKAAADGRFCKFTPASGAASRMFRELLQFHVAPSDAPSWSEVQRRADDGDGAAQALVAFVEGLEDFPFRDELLRASGGSAEALRARVTAGDYLPLLDALLGVDGLDYASLPKGLLKFHAYPSGSRTPLEEHLVEGARVVRDASGRCDLHFTVSPEHEEGFRRRVAATEDELGRESHATFDVDYSWQHPSTDTLAIDTDGRPVRGADGRLLFRPGGHGALIRNLADLEGDLVYVKNIDNVQPDRLKDDVVAWKRTLGGYLVELQRRMFEAPAADGADRPIRVCGVVRNTGEPGGGPFWVRDSDGAESLQIVESAEVDPDDADQQAIFRSSTHFNPVDLVCALRDREGRPFDLTRWIDEDRVIVASKSSGGRDLLALERPGLWNGAMAGWHTVFVEVPLVTFSPVKTVLDLLRQEHRTAAVEAG